MPVPDTLAPVRADEKPVAEYRSLAPLAIVSVGLGIAAALILTTPLLAPIPVAGIIVALAALRSIRTSGGELTGATIAIVGLSLSTFFLGWGLSQHLGRQAVLDQRAREIADVFLDLLMQGRLREAHQFRQSPSLRITAPEAIAEHYEKNKEAAQELQTFSLSTGVKDLVTYGKAADVRFETVASATRDGQTDTLVLRYSYAPGSAAAERKPLWVHITRRYDDGSKRHQWEVGGIQDTTPYGITE
jgi:hypothetical protein